MLILGLKVELFTCTTSNTWILLTVNFITTPQTEVEQSIYTLSTQLMSIIPSLKTTLLFQKVEDYSSTVLILQVDLPIPISPIIVQELTVELFVFLQMALTLKISLQ